MGNKSPKTQAQKDAEKAARIAAAKNAAGLENEGEVVQEVVESTEDDDGVSGLVPDTDEIPELQKPAELTPEDFAKAEKMGVPPLPKRYTQRYLDLRTTYVRFIKQSPHKWNVNTDEGKTLLANLKALEVK